MFKRPDESFRSNSLLRLMGLKGHKDDPRKWKDTSLKLLSAALFFEDTLRMLLYVALVEGHIQGATRRTELQDLAMRRAKGSGTFSVQNS
jgi:hypothetical protein